MKEILTKHGEVTMIAKLFGVSDVTVRNALKCRTKSVLSSKIRNMALARGGAEFKINQ